MADLISNLGYSTKHGKNRETVQKRLNQFGISTEHFVSHVPPRKITEEDVFCKNSNVSQSTLKRFYLKLKDVKYECVECGTKDTWNDKQLVLQLDHKDGNNKNNLLDNLRWLCPNCHSQTKTFAGKNITVSDNTEKKRFCIDCGNEISHNATRCVRCNNKVYKGSKMPTAEILETLIKSHKGNVSSIAKIYLVSDNAVKKWCDKYNLWNYVIECRNKNKKPKKERSPLVKCKVEQIDKNTNQVIASYNSVKEAEKLTGIYHIGDASNPNHSRKTAGGYIWRRI